MYDVQFSVPAGDVWGQAIEIINANTNEPLDLSEYEVEISIQDRGDCYWSITGNTDDGTVYFPQTGVIQWEFPADRLGRLCARNTYQIRCRVTNEDIGPQTIFTGTLAYL